MPRPSGRLRAVLLLLASMSGCGFPVYAGFVDANPDASIDGPTGDVFVDNAPSCGDGIKNGGETGTDCGGVCQKCEIGEGCLREGDCASGVCFNNVCIQSPCTDHQKNLLETDIDCGGGTCSPCGTGKLCAVDNDCQGGACTNGKCQPTTCGNGIVDANETDVDCGGFCAPCLDGKVCSLGADCTSGACTSADGITSTCQAGACSLGQDNLKDGTETDVDCGGGCPPCAETKGCRVGADCLSGACINLTCAAPSCSDTVQNQGETDADCGGATSCPRCGGQKKCAGDADCLSAHCVANLCIDAGCTDHVRNQSETDVDCGGTCPACADAQKCLAALDCQSGVCKAEICAVPACTDGITNGNETDRDCGGAAATSAACPRCGPGLTCKLPSDCAGGACTSGYCQPAACANTKLDPGETDIDCGGGACVKCVDQKTCAAASDCASGVCAMSQDLVTHVLGLHCQPPSCSDKLENGNETDRDCGGSCQHCPSGGKCRAPGDCASGVCSSGICQAPLCSDKVQNQDESDVDCGGKCAPCPSGRGCNTKADCTSGVCTGTQCQTANCSDNVRNGAETDIDCGGPTCPKCDDAKMCAADPTNCKDGVCKANACQAPACNDGVKNGSETDKDCGSSCPKCAAGSSCQGPGDCSSGVCGGKCVTPSCSDLIKNGNETDQDCGGGAPCAGCANGLACKVAADCQSNVCLMGLCQPPGALCNDNLKDGGETDKDCGGATTCARCMTGATCAAGSDCVEQVCATTCKAATCADGKKNQDETDVDCGGATCVPMGKLCPNSGHCSASPDCQSGVCKGGICQAPTCTDNVQNGGESDADCGGTCTKCGTAKTCTGASDCQSAVCTTGVCQAATCSDHAINQTETDVDCGGVCAPQKLCGNNQGCLSGTDCATTSCTAMHCDSTCPTCLKLEYRCGQTASSTPILHFLLRVVNTTASPVALNALRLRYYFTNDLALPPALQVDTGGGGQTGVQGPSGYRDITAEVTRAIVPAAPAVGGKAYVEITFQTTAVLATTGDNVTTLIQVHRSDYNASFNQLNDWSFDATKTDYTAWDHVTLERQGVLIWGTPAP